MISWLNTVADVRSQYLAFYLHVTLKNHNHCLLQRIQTSSKEARGIGGSLLQYMQWTMIELIRASMSLTEWRGEHLEYRV